MLLSEKGLARQLKAAYARGGYTINSTAEQLIIYTKGWYVRATWDKFPVKALATIVEHMGQLPTEACTLFLSKASDPQQVMPDKVGDEVAFWEKEEQGSQVMIVPMTVADCQILQERVWNLCYGVVSGSLDIVTGGDSPKTDAVCVGDRIRYRDGADDDVVVMIRAHRGSDPAYEESYLKDLWKALETVRLTPERRSG